MTWIIISEVLKQLGIWIGLILLLIFLWAASCFIYDFLDAKGWTKSKVKSPCFVEWNEEFLSKMSPEARAEYEKALKAHREGKC